MCLGEDWEVQARYMRCTCVVRARRKPGESDGKALWRVFVPLLPRNGRECSFPQLGRMRVWSGGRGWQRKHGSQGPARMTPWTSGDFVGGSDGDDLSALVAGVGAEVYDPIGGFHDVEIVLDDQHRVAGIHKPLKHSEQHTHVVEVQAGRRLVEQEQGRSRPVLRSPSSVAVLRRMDSTAEGGRSADFGAGLPASAATIASARCRTSFRRWLSPPERVLMGWPSLR